MKLAKNGNIPWSILWALSLAAQGFAHGYINPPDSPQLPRPAHAIAV
ncbi:hypothetical protein [Roseateles oligotrophus]|uniref:Uncharacterized protein n=1 Tax=Roseateles oligotrophus TaxID=1769250 RepID=A0ABT2YJ38_9BURK|nr:hypothetical protein [Roseateles oligotrophus]MCV2369940.1 hypothetical protein [Roseateles oligotrophus]